MKKKYALLDTDFISKTHLIQGDEGKPFIELLVGLLDFCFFCHSQVVEEISRHNEQASNWLRKGIVEQKVRCYTDEAILEELTGLRGDLACLSYAELLRSACDAFSSSYFHTYYQAVDEFDYIRGTRAEFLKVLQMADREVGRHNSLGEIKSYVLLQFLSLLHGCQIYMFCSDDRAARNGAISFDDVSCMSVLSTFQILKEQYSWPIAEAMPYIESYVAFCNAHGQETFRVMEETTVPRMKRVPCRQVLLEVYEDKYVVLRNGFLRYRED